MFSGPKRKTSAVIRLHLEFSGAIRAKNLGQKIDTAERDRDRTTKRDFVPQIFCQTFVRFLWSASHAATRAMNSSLISGYSCSILLVAAEGDLSVVLPRHPLA